MTAVCHFLSCWKIIIIVAGMGEDIFREVTQQNDLIDDIDDRVENVNQRLLDTTSNVRVVSKRDKTCGYWVIILLLAIAIIAVLAS